MLPDEGDADENVDETTSLTEYLRQRLPGLLDESSSPVAGAPARRLAGDTVVV